MQLVHHEGMVFSRMAAAFAEQSTAWAELEENLGRLGKDGTVCGS